MIIYVLLDLCILYNSYYGIVNYFRSDLDILCVIGVFVVLVICFYFGYVMW